MVFRALLPRTATRALGVLCLLASLGTAPIAFADTVLDAGFEPGSRSGVARIPNTWNTRLPVDADRNPAHGTTAVLLTQRFELTGAAASGTLDRLPPLAGWSATLHAYHRAIASHRSDATETVFGADALAEDGSCEATPPAVLLSPYTEFAVDELRLSRPGGGYATVGTGGRVPGHRIAGDLRDGVDLPHWLDVSLPPLRGAITWTEDPTAGWITRPVAAASTTSPGARKTPPLSPWAIAGIAMAATALLLWVHGRWRAGRRARV